MNWKLGWELVKESYVAWVDDNAQSMGAALAYYTMFSIAPLLLIVITVSGYFFGTDAAQSEIIDQLHGLIGKDGVIAIEGLLNSVSAPKGSLTATIIGIGLLGIGATTVFKELQNSLDRIWETPVKKNSNGIREFLRTRFLSIVLIFGIAFLLIVSLILSAAIAMASKWWGPLFGGLTTLLEVVNFVVSFILTTVIIAMIYKIMPKIKIRWHDVWIGATVTAILFTVGKFLIGLYIGKSGVTSGFGAAASLVATLVWVYYSAQIFLIGAEFTWVYAHKLGSRRGMDNFETTHPNHFKIIIC